MSDVHNVLSLTALLSSWRLRPMASFMESIHLIFSSSFPSAFYFPQHYCFFQKILPSHDVPEVEQLKRTAVIFIARIHWILECSKEFQKKAGLCFLDNRTVKPLTTLNMRSSGLLWEKWVCLSTRLSCCTPCTEKRKSLSGQNAERRNGFP